MFGRPGRLALALSLALPAAALAQGFEYAAGTAQYRITSKQKAAQEMMGQKQEFESSNNQLVTVNVARAAKDTVSMSIVLDSISAVGPMGAGMERLRGSKVVAKLSPFGAVYSAVGPTDDSVPNGAQLTEEMSRFLPKIRTKLTPGATWSDTTTGKVKQGTMNVERKVVANYKVLGDTTLGGEKSWRIARDAVTSLSGSGLNQGQQMSMEGTSNANGTLFVSQKGTFLGGESEDHASVKIVIAANGMEVAVTTTANTKIEKVK